MVKEPPIQPSPFSDDLVSETRKYIFSQLEAYRHTKTAPPDKLLIASEELSSDVSLKNTIKDPKNKVLILSCEHFDSLCKKKYAQRPLKDHFCEHFKKPQFYPSIEQIGKSFYYDRYRRAFQFNNAAAIYNIIKGLNDELPEVAVLFDAVVNEKGSAISNEVLIPGFGESAAVLEAIRSIKDNVSYPVEKVKELIVVSHPHSGMFWHQMLSEFFRIFNLFPYLRENPDICIHTISKGGDREWTARLYEMVGISRNRLKENVIRADIVYYTPILHKHDVPPLGLALLIREHLLYTLHGPGYTSESVFCKRTGYTQPININILITKRDPSSNKGRAIANHEDLKFSLVALGAAYATKIEAVTSQKVSIQVLEHLPSHSTKDTLYLFSIAGELPPSP